MPHRASTSGPSRDRPVVTLADLEEVVPPTCGHTMPSQCRSEIRSTSASRGQRQPRQRRDRKTSRRLSIPNGRPCRSAPVRKPAASPAPQRLCRSAYQLGCASWQDRHAGADASRGQRRSETVVFVQVEPGHYRRTEVTGSSECSRHRDPSRFKPGDRVVSRGALLCSMLWTSRAKRCSPR